ncbi:MAG TPA: hypothetical protein PKE03_08055, partial [Bacteroidales bacterium]|nr:hypothetical protein [Bacteroidales bacterium]
MKTQSTIATLVLLGIMMLVRLQGISAEPAGMDKMAVRLQEAYSASASDGTVQNLKPGEGFRLTYSFNANDGVVIPLGRDAIVFVADARHPSAGLLRNNGLSFDGIKQLIMNKSDALSIADELIYEKLIHFLNIQPLQAPPFSSFSKEMRVGSVHAMLFSEMGAELFAEGNNLMIVPLDRNGNGQLEDNESFYASFETFSRAVWLGKYPKAFTLTLNAVVPADGIADNQFVQWLLSDGQQMIASNGFIPLNAHELMANRNRLQTTALTQLEDASASTIPLWVIIVIVFAALAIVFYLIISALTRPHSPVGETSAKP